MANPTPAGIFIGVSIVVSVLAGASHIYGHGATSSAAGGGVGLVSLIFIRAMVLYALSIADKKPLSVSQFFDVNVKQFIFLILAVIAVGVMLIVSAILILIPWIWLVSWFSVTTYALVEKDLDPLAAIGESRRLARNHKGKVWGIVGWIFLVSIAAAIVGIIPFVSYLLQPALVILETATLAIFYRWLTTQSKVAAT